MDQQQQDAAPIRETTMVVNATIGVEQKRRHCRSLHWIFACCTAEALTTHLFSVKTKQDRWTGDAGGDAWNRGQGSGWRKSLDGQGGVQTTAQEFSLHVCTWIHSFCFCLHISDKCWSFRSVRKQKQERKHKMLQPCLHLKIYKKAAIEDLLETVPLPLLEK